MNPYGIEQVNIPGILNSYLGQQQARTQQMMAQRQVEAAERQAERENGIRAAVARYALGGNSAGGAPGNPSSRTTTTPSATPSVGGLEGAVQTMTAQPAPVEAAATPATPDRRQQLFNELLALDPETAFQTMQAFSQMDEANFERVSRSNAVLGREAYRLRSMPLEQRRAELQRIAPQLQQMGLTSEQLSGFDPTDQNLDMIIGQARDIEKLAEEARPRLRAVEGELLDENRLAQGQDPVVWRSEYMNGPGGIYRRPNAGLAGEGGEQAPVRVSTPEEARRLPPGTPILLPDGTVGTVPGGPTPAASGNFPQGEW